MVFTNSSVFDPFSDTLAGDSVRIFNYGGSRIDNTVNYSFAAQNGINGQAAYSFGEVAGSTSAGRTVAGAIGYASGPIAAVLTYQNTNNATATDSTKTTLIGGNYNFGLLQPFIAYAMNKGFGTLDTRDSLIGLKVNLTAADTIMASYMHKSDKAISNANANQIALGYTHNLSTRTNLYTSWGRLRNDANAAYRVTAAGKPTICSTSAYDTNFKIRSAKTKRATPSRPFCKHTYSSIVVVRIEVRKQHIYVTELR